jgi:hypothetical protein
VKAKLRCGHNVTGHVDIQVWYGPPGSIPISDLETLNCGETFKFQLGAPSFNGQLHAHFEVTKEGGPLIQCPSPTGYFQDYIPVRKACGKLAVVSARYTKK